MPRKKRLSEQVVVIGGGSYGLGRAIVREAARLGAKLVVGARTPEPLEGSLADIEAAGAEGLTVEVDVGDRAQVQRLVDSAVERFGRIDTYIANGMVTVYAEAYRLEEDELRRIFDVNFFGGVYGYWAALPHLRETHGTFIQVASALSYRGIPLQAGYCATKAALRAFFESARVELRKKRTGVDVCLILPGAINTPQFGRARQKIGYQPQPIPPIYQPEPFAAAIVRCCERPARELPLGWGAQKLLWGQKLSPRAGDLILLRNGWKSQHTGEPKRTDSPDNLFKVVPGDPGGHGRFDDRARPTSAWTSLRLRRGLIGAGVALGTMAGLLAGRPGRFPSRKRM